VVEVYHFLGECPPKEATIARLVFLGIQGSGKGTQADLMQQRHGLAHVNVGDLFRWHMQNNTDIGARARNYVEQGLLVPDEVVLQIVTRALEEAGNRFVLDGFPRNRAQAEHLLNDIPVDAAVLFDLSDDMARARILARRVCTQCGATYHLQHNPPQAPDVCDRCGGRLALRKDDNPEAVNKRMEDFHTQTDDAIRLFSERGLLLRVDADQPIETLHNQVLGLLQGAGISL